MAYLKKVLFILPLFFVLNIQGQQLLSPNFINNPSFEDYYNCPDMMAELYNAKNWWGFSTDYFNSCANMYVSVPANLTGFQYAHTGNAYAGLIIYANDVLNYDYRETIKTKLNDSLIINKRYCTKFYISLANFIFQNYYVLLDSIGVLLTKDSVPDTDTAFLSNGIKAQNNIFNLDTVNWLKISNSFIANGGEQYLTIGNFDNVINYLSGVLSEIYVYVDDVSVCECSFTFNLGNDTTLCIGESLILNPNMPNATYTWQDGSHDSTYKVTQAGTYWIRAYFPDYNITTYDTINVMYKDCDTIDTNDNIISIYPNPATDNLTIETNFKEEHRLEIINLLGQAIYTTYIGRKSMINTSNYASGLYFLKIYTDKEIVVRKFVKE